MRWYGGIDSWLRKLGGVAQARVLDNCLGCWSGYAREYAREYGRDYKRRRRLHRRKFGRHYASFVSAEAAPCPSSPFTWTVSEKGGQYTWVQSTSM